MRLNPSSAKVGISHSSWQQRPTLVTKNNVGGSRGDVVMSPFTSLLTMQWTTRYFYNNFESD